MLFCKNIGSKIETDRVSTLHVPTKMQWPCISVLNPAKFNSMWEEKYRPIERLEHLVHALAPERPEGLWLGITPLRVASSLSS